MANNGKAYSIEETLKSLEKDIKDLTDDMKAKAKQQVQILAAQAHALILAKAQAKLSSTRKIYTDALGLQKIASSGDNEIWAVTLDKSAKWIEDPMPNHSMLDYLLKSPKAKMGKNGKYIVIPFEHSKPANEQSETQSKIAKYAKNVLKEQGLDKVITRDGKPILGKVATVKVNGEDQPRGRFNQPLLSGLTIYQREMKNKHGETMKDKAGNARIKKDTFTFRVASESQRGSGLWEKKSTPGLRAFEETERQLDVIWEQMVKDLVK